MWSKLHNSDSWGTDTMTKAIDLARMYDKDIRDVLLGVGGTMATPMILQLPSDVHVLVGGNTRLMVYRGLNARPHVMLIDLRHLPATYQPKSQGVVQ